MKDSPESPIDKPTFLPVAAKPSEALGDSPLIDFAPLWDWLRLALGAVNRQRRNALLGFGGGLLLTLVGFALFPRTYHTETRIRAQRNLVMPALGNPHRAVPIDSDTPTRAVSETILTRENLLSMISQVGLAQRWVDEMAPAQRLRYWIGEKLKPQTEQQKLDALVGLLELRLHLTTDDATVTIGIDWQNPKTAYDLVQQAQVNFLEARHETEVSTIAETISILERHASDTRATMEQTVEQLDKARAAIAAQAAGLAPIKAATEPASPKLIAHAREKLTDDEAELSELKAQLEAKRQQITELEQSREKERGRLTALLAQQRAIYAPAHPAIVETEEQLKRLSVPPELAAMQMDEQDLAERVQRALAAVRNAREDMPRGGELDRPLNRGEERRREEDTRVEYPKTQLKIAADGYEDLLRRIDAARIELDTAQAAFKYRYRVIRPAEVPAHAAKPKAILVCAAAIFCGLLLAVLAALISDRRGGLIRSRLQVEKQLGLPVLAELGRP